MRMLTRMGFLLLAYAAPELLSLLACSWGAAHLTMMLPQIQQERCPAVEQPAARMARPSRAS
eukprot:3451683-Alexandrium_andersonii.AAC.1